MASVLLALALALLLAPPPTSSAAAGDVVHRGDPPPCSLNGAKAAGGSCSCDPGWVGDACERLNLLPANLSQGANWLTEAGGAAGNASSLAHGGTSSWGVRTQAVCRCL